MSLSQRQEMIPKKVTMTRKLQQDDKQIIISHGQRQAAALAEGSYINYANEGAFMLHGGISHELTDSNVVATTPASVIITLLLEGSLIFGYDDLEFNLEAGKQAQGVIVNFTQPASFRRRLQKDNHVVKLNIILDQAWLSKRIRKPCPLTQFIQQDKAFCHLTLSEEMVSGVRRILATPKPQTLLETLHLEHAAIDLVLKTVEQLEPLNHEQTTGEARSYCSQMGQIVHFLDQHLYEELSLDALAQQMAMSTSNLQRKFKQQMGMTVANYVRQRRLNNARQQLERGYVTITEAAYEAGYHHPSNFTAAFKKAFGQSPQAFVAKQSD
ncbi:helix-turn-helix transcriptional regulator [Vibrio fluvialis]|uniref:helix-turn-helix transcriptional regulator n=1 Tax=Vibrio fluvialis TaxID=676 RepID=UPI000A7619F5|nr:AraC family transcriptional regulator [Vibrio fluvialis]